MSVIDDARDVILRRLASQAHGLPADAVRNLATAYGILTDKALAEGRIQTVTLADGSTVNYDAFGNEISGVLR